MKILSFGSLNYDYTYEVEHFLAPKETLAAKSILQLPGTLTAAIFWRAFAAAVQ